MCKPAGPAPDRYNELFNKLGMVHNHGLKKPPVHQTGETLPGTEDDQASASSTPNRPMP